MVNDCPRFGPGRRIFSLNGRIFIFFVVVVVVVILVIHLNLLLFDPPIPLLAPHPIQSTPHSVLRSLPDMMLNSLTLHVIDDIDLMLARRATHEIQQTQSTEIPRFCARVDGFEVSVGAARHAGEHDGGREDGVAGVDEEVFEAGEGEEEVPG